ncbi:hypothetical protein BXZ70DRAFT_1009703 [Cristinia sonorae]|uniref:Inhibitor of growth protein N-terminal histone-binding domain-containing protein n=1 Tax=Cristinia sonorae TaxID=1940300 RepID=A0A8K0ULD0_9AGAR|nr:hypothetical protein BXZ70DRAFT_1009703 [Cristinia sonorae]
MNATNLEEAATVASEFISSLDNLPHEVQHLLAEIKFKDMRAQELQQEINKESAKYMRHSSRGAQAVNQKDLAIPQLVRAHYAEIDKLSDEKLALAERIVRLIGRAQVRLEVDLQKVLVLQGEEPIPTQATASYFANAATRTPMTQVLDDLRSAVSVPTTASVATPPPFTPSSSTAAPPAKRPRTAATIKMPSPAPVPTAASSSRVTGGGPPGSAVSVVTSQRVSRLSQQVHPRQSPSRTTRRVTASVGPDPDEDAEGEDEPEDAAEDLGEVEEDKEIYCFCRKLSYGEFHLPCVNLKAPLPESWFCSECGGTGMERRKGRKK